MGQEITSSLTWSCRLPVLIAGGGGPQLRGPRLRSELKRHRCFHLNDSDRSISPKTRTKDAGRLADSGRDGSERSGEIVVRQIEIRVVEEVEELEGQSEFTLFPVRNFRFLLGGEVRVPVTGSAKDISQTTNEVRL